MKIVKKMVFYGSFSGTAPNQKKSFKKGFSLIELVLAIVVVAITLAALPNIVAQTQKSNELAIKQELTYSAKTLMGRIISMPWDSTAFRTMCEDDGRTCNSEAAVETYLREKRGNIRIPIYNAIPLNGVNGARSRPGSLIADGSGFDKQNRIIDRNKIYRPGHNSYGFNRQRNDIDDFDGSLITRNKKASNEDFISDMRFDTEVRYVNDSANFSLSDKGSRINGGIPTNIKRIKVTVEDTAEAAGTGEYKSTMYFYAPNIGMNKPMTTEYKGM